MAPALPLIFAVDVRTSHKSNCCCRSGYRVDNLTIGLTDVSPEDTVPTLGSYDECGHYVGFVTAAVAPIYLQCVTNLAPRRYLIAQRSGNTTLKFCEIEVIVRRKSIFVSWGHTLHMYTVSHKTFLLYESTTATFLERVLRFLQRVRITCPTVLIENPLTVVVLNQN